MNYEDLIKDDKIKWTVKHLADKFGRDNFKIKDHWDADLCAIGLTDNGGKYLMYISVCDRDGYFVSLENLVPFNDLPYEPVGDFNNLGLEELEKIFAQHLRL